MAHFSNDEGNHVGRLVYVEADQEYHSRDEVDEDEEDIQPEVDSVHS